MNAHAQHEAFCLSEFRLSRELASGFIDALRSVSRGASDPDATAALSAELDAIAGVKVSVNRDGESYKMRISVRSGEDGAQDVAEFERLSAGIDSLLGVLAGYLQRGVLPPGAVVESFLADSQRLYLHPVFGGERYAHYANLCVGFGLAFERGDTPEMAALGEELAACRRQPPAEPA
jgi:XXXCH domain-containing protein